MAETPLTSCTIDAVNGTTISGYREWSVNNFLMADVTLFLQIVTLSIARSSDDNSDSILDNEHTLATISPHS